MGRACRAAGRSGKNAAPEGAAGYPHRVIPPHDPSERPLAATENSSVLPASRTLTRSLNPLIAIVIRKLRTFGTGLVQLMRTFAHWAVVLLSGEWLLKLPNRPANGGGVIAFRSLMVAITLFAIFIALESAFQPNVQFEFSWTEAKRLVAARLPWFGAIFAGVYTALYSRFSSQWNYLAGFYNQIMQAELQIALTEPGLPVPSTTATDKASPSAREIMAAWKAAFIEDAEDLHLATKAVFAPAVAGYLSDDLVQEYYVANTVRGRKRLEKLTTLLSDALQEQEREARSETPDGSLAPDPSGDANPAA
jgi:hypothetical protein